MNKAILIKKEVLPNNFKLTFRNQEKTQFLILHEEEKEIYNLLEINQEYFYTWRKGKSNYCFINSRSIKKNTKKIEYPTEKQKQATLQQNSFTQQLIKDLKLKDLTEEEFFNKIECLKDEFKTTKQKDSLKFAFKWIKEFITTLYLKHNQLEKSIIKHNYTEQEQREQDFLAELGALFLNDWIYYQDKRESKYNRHYFLNYLKNKQEK